MAPRRRIIPVFIPHYGCEHDCVFCNQRSISGVSAPARPEDVRAAIRSALADMANSETRTYAAELALYGGSFTALPVEQQEGLLSAAQELLEISLENSIRVSTRPDCIDELTVRRLKGFGVRTIELGAQSMCNEVLRLSRRGHTAADVEAAAELIKSSGLSLILQMMTGLPGDTDEKSISTARQFAALKPDGVRIYPTVVVQGTALYDMWREGTYREHTVDDAVELCAGICAIFEGAGIPIIRLGLNPSERLSAGEAAAGAYHPSLGELVYSRVCLNTASDLLEGVSPGSDVVITVSKGSLSQMVGHRRKNVEALIGKFSLRSLKVVESDVKIVTNVTIL
ncbi:MAG: radical SAM protein [Oscillospiraceae bacterium]|nr:radical SAM protein [Oscillospiraceae bacterium]